MLQKPDARDVLGARGGPGDCNDVTLVLVVGAREVELVRVLEYVVFVLEFVQVVPVVLQGECVQQGLPAGTELAERLEAAVESGIVEAALACDDLAVLDGDEASLQYGFGLYLARGVPGGILFADDAHQQDGARLELCRENLVHVAAGLLAEFLHGFFGHNTLELPEVELEALELARVVEEHAVDRAVQVVAQAGALGAVSELGLGQYETAQLHLQVADVCLQGALGGVLAPRIERGHDLELCLAPVFDAFLFEQVVEKVGVEFFFEAFERGTHGEAEVAVVEFQRLGERLFHVLFFDVAFFDHAPEYVA